MGLAQQPTPNTNHLLLGHMSGDQFLATFLHASQPFDDRVFDFVEARFFDPDF